MQYDVNADTMYSFTESFMHYFNTAITALQSVCSFFYSCYGFWGSSVPQLCFVFRF